MAKKKGTIQKIVEAAKDAAGNVVEATQNVLENVGLRREARKARRTTRRAKIAEAVGVKPAKKKTAKPAEKAAAKPAKKKAAKKAAKKK
jgi:hypothetical protein